MREGSKKLKYAIAAVATAAVLAGAVFLGKKCSHEDIQKRMEPEGPKKTLVTGYDKKKVAKDLAKLITSVTLIEETTEIVDGVEIEDDSEGTVKRIIADIPYDSMLCDRTLPFERKCEEKPTYEWIFPGSLYHSYALTHEKIKTYLDESRKLMDELNELCEESGGVADMEEILMNCTAVGMEVENLILENKTKQLLSVLRYTDSLGIYGEDGEYGRATLVGEYLMQNAEAPFLDGMGYQRGCIVQSLKAMLTARVIIDGLSEAVRENDDDIAEIFEKMPADYYAIFISKIDKESVSRALHEIEDEHIRYGIYMGLIKSEKWKRGYEEWESPTDEDHENESDFEDEE